jgi:hypothetical protein
LYAKQYINKLDGAVSFQLLSYNSALI